MRPAMLVAPGAVAFRVEGLRLAEVVREHVRDRSGKKDTLARVEAIAGKRERLGHASGQHYGQRIKPQDLLHKSTQQVHTFYGVQINDSKLQPSSQSKPPLTLRLSRLSRSHPCLKSKSRPSWWAKRPLKSRSRRRRQSVSRGSPDARSYRPEMGCSSCTRSLLC